MIKHHRNNERRYVGSGMKLTSGWIRKLASVTILSMMSMMSIGVNLSVFTWSGHSSSSSEKLSTRNLSPSYQTTSRSNNTTTKTAGIEMIDKVEMNMGACCVITEEDSRLLNEWLAYHYITLPLKYLIVVLDMDQESKTMPKEILSRWNSRIQMDLWWEKRTNLEFQPEKVDETEIEESQNDKALIYTDCLKAMKAQGVDWVLLTDTNEYIRPSIGYSRVSDQLMRRNNIATKNCITVPRYEVASKDVDIAHSHRKLITMRFFYRGTHPMLDENHGKIVGKNIVHVTALNESEISINMVHTSIPYCNVSATDSHQDLPMIYHYAKTREQFNYSDDDDVTSKNQTKQHRLRGNHAELLDASLAFWIDELVKLVGPDEAGYLLHGVIEVGGEHSNLSAIDNDHFLKSIGYSANATSTDSIAVPQNLSEHAHPFSPNESLIGDRFSNDMRANTTMHLIMGLFGAKVDFFSELEVALKSILINAPLERDLQIHFLADKSACEPMMQLLRRINVESWKTRNKISFVVHNVEPHIEGWIDKVNHVYENERKEKNIYRHTIGAYFRLFAHEILDKDVQNALYMDSDVVIIANLDELWRVRVLYHFVFDFADPPYVQLTSVVLQHVNPEKVFQWGNNSLCSGFMIMNVQKLAEIWDRMPLLGPWKPTETPGDQIILRSFHSKFPKLVGSLPLEWDISARNGFMGDPEGGYLEANPRKVAKWLKDGAGMLHFNGGGESVESYFKVHPQVSAKYKDTFGLARFYVDIPWSWVKFVTKSMCRDSISFSPTVVKQSRNMLSETKGEGSFEPPLVSALSDETGIVGPIDLSAVVSAATNCTRQYKEWGIRKKRELVSLPYVKSPFAYTEACREMALHSDLVKQAQALIGQDDIMVASMSPLFKLPGWQHRWHSDVESVVDASCKEHVWTAWLPVLGSSDKAGLHFITHTSNSSILAQTFLEEKGLLQCKTCEEAKGQKRFEDVGKILLLHAKTLDENSRYVQIPAKPGHAWFFKGTTFHGSINRSDEPRHAFQFHFMPSKCRFRMHHMERNTWPHPDTLIKELPVVIPVLGNSSIAPFSIKGAITEHGIEPFPLNNWYFPNMPKPEKVYYKNDRTKYLVKIGVQNIVNLPQVFSFENDWIDLPCTKQGNSASGLIDTTKCKQPMFEGGTKFLRHMEYHASQLRKNSAAHSLRYHEEYELLYVARGKVVVSLAQTAPHEKILYRKEVSAGGLAFYPAWQAHGVTAIEEPEAAYIAIRWLGKASEEPVPASHVKLWEDLDKVNVGRIKPVEVSTLQSLSVIIETVGKKRSNSSLKMISGEDTMILTTNGSVQFQGKEIKSPGTVFVPSTDITNSTAVVVEVPPGSRALVVRIRPKA